MSSFSCLEGLRVTLTVTPRIEVCLSSVGSWIPGVRACAALIATGAAVRRG